MWQFMSLSHVFISLALHFFCLPLSYVRLRMIIIKAPHNLSESGQFSLVCVSPSAGYGKVTAFLRMNFGLLRDSRLILKKCVDKYGTLDV